MPEARPYQAYARDREAPSFTGWLRASAAEPFERMLGHRFVQEVTAGTIDRRVFEAYLLQEYAFVDTSAAAAGYAVGKAPSMAERRRLVAALDGLVTDQRAFFERAFDELGVAPERWREPELAPATARFRDLVLRAAAAGGYEEALTPSTAAEWLYATWCRAAVEDPDAAPEAGPPGAAEWVELHVEDSFQEHARWLRGQLDDLGPSLPAHRQRRVRELFRRTVEAEIAFHAAPYDVVEG